MAGKKKSKVRISDLYCESDCDERCLKTCKKLAKRIKKHNAAIKHAKAK